MGDFNMQPGFETTSQRLRKSTVNDHSTPSQAKFHVKGF